MVMKYMGSLFRGQGMAFRFKVKYLNGTWRFIGITMVFNVVHQCPVDG